MVKSATIDEKKGELTVVVTFDSEGTPSASGKSNVHATTRGNQPTTATVNGKPLIVSVNAYVPV